MGFLTEELKLNIPESELAEMDVLRVIRNKVVHNNSCFTNDEKEKLKKLCNLYTKINFIAGSNKLHIEKTFIDEAVGIIKSVFKNIKKQLLDKGIIKLIHVDL